MPNCSDQVFYHILRPLIKSGSVDFGDAAEPPPHLQMLKNITIEPGSWDAHDKYVKIGWIIKSIDGHAYSDSILKEKTNGTSPYEVTFLLPGVRKLSGPSGAMSSLLPCLDAALGIKMSAEKLKSTLETFSQSMPTEHREFLNSLRGHTSIRDRISNMKSPATDHQDMYAPLARAFNRIIARVLEFRWQHWRFVTHFIMNPGNLSYGIGSGGTSFDFLQQHLTDTERARLTERDEYSLVASPSQHDSLPVRPNARTQHATLEFWSVDGENGLLGRDCLFGPRAVSPADLPASFRNAEKALCALAMCMPSLLASGEFAAHVKRAEDNLAALQDVRSIVDLAEAGRERLMSVLSHVAAGCVGEGRSRRIPKCINSAFQLVARAVGRPARLEFTELVLVNWQGYETLEPADCRTNASESIPEQETPRINVALRFLASPDEDWYRAMHIVLHHDFREVVKQIRVGQVAMRGQNDRGVVDSMVKLSLCIRQFCHMFDVQLDMRDSRRDAVLFRRLLPYMTFSRVECTIQEVACHVYLSGGTVLISALHAYLGIRMAATGAGSAVASPATVDGTGALPTGVEGPATDVEQLASLLRHTLAILRPCMPSRHREFLEELERPGASLRHYCIRRFGLRTSSVEQLHDLEVSYNDALAGLGRFLSLRTRLIVRLTPEFSAIFNNLQSEIESTLVRSQLRLLRMRRRVDRSLE
eukprot:TRINITY_DN24164_c0_g1_i1.p1 TRINITY_DN24164_c0_g1~~TRINITY_DN24164_c0_g1_i1.p1  ORF type:complete len:765 (-),score=103.98 TRINITY_DN24164_c0_g1_i1:141-2246(-)